MERQMMAMEQSKEDRRVTELLCLVDKKDFEIETLQSRISSMDTRKWCVSVAMAQHSEMEDPGTIDDVLIDATKIAQFLAGGDDLSFKPVGGSA
jgi:hypothetical protein